MILSRAPTVTVWPPLPLPSSRVSQCLLLALLLHLLLILMIGTTPGGSAAPGEGVWGTLNVTLVGPASSRAEDRSAEVSEPAPPLVDSGPVGQAPRQRFGGAVRPGTPVRPVPGPELTQPGAAELGRWNPAPAEQLNGPAAETSPSMEPEPSTPTAVLQTPQQAVERLQRPAPLTATPPARTQESLKSLTAAPPVPAPVPAPPLTPTPAAVTPPVPDIAPTPPVELPPPPVLRSLPEPAPLTRRPAAEQPLAVPKAQPVPETLAVPKALPEIAPAPAAPVQAPKVQPVPAPQPAPGTSTAPAPNPSAAPGGNTTSASPSLLPIAPPVGAPDAGTRVGRNVATPPSASASAPRTPLDLRLPVNGPLARQGNNSLLELMPHPPDTKTKLGEDMKEAGRKDCAKAYENAGILAAIPLAVDTARDKGCKW